MTNQTFLFAGCVSHTFKKGVEPVTILITLFRHGINKKITRRAQRFKQVTGFAAEATHDALFDALHLKFEEQQEIAQQLARDIQGWIRQVRSHFDALHTFAESLETLYSSWGGVRVRSMQGVQDLSKATSTFSSVMARELVNRNCGHIKKGKCCDNFLCLQDTKVQGYVYRRIDDFLRVFENPSQVIAKRAQKLLDFDRVRDIKSKGDTPDKALQESADAYVSINAQLVDELPKFFELTTRYFDVLVSELAAVQSEFYAQMAHEWQKLVARHLSQSDSDDDIVAHYLERMASVEPLVQDIAPLNKEFWENMPDDTPPGGGDDSLRSMSFASFGSPGGNQQPQQDHYFARRTMS